MASLVTHSVRYGRSSILALWELPLWELSLKALDSRRVLRYARLMKVAHAADKARRTTHFTWKRDGLDLYVGAQVPGNRTGGRIIWKILENEEFFSARAWHGKYRLVRRCKTRSEAIEVVEVWLRERIPQRHLVFVQPISH